VDCQRKWDAPELNVDCQRKGVWIHTVTVKCF
jgi:hypothetical protein